MDVFVAGFGLLLLVIATLLNLRGRRRASVGRVRLGLPAAVLVALLLSTTAYAHHDVITPATYWWIPPQWNGYKVYLSSPTHIAAQRGFAQRNESILRVAQERYRFAMKTIAADQGFRVYLEQNAAPPR